MTNIRTYARAFNGGELTPEFFGQIADAKFQTGLALCRNFIVLPHGPVSNRPGTKFVRETKDSSKKSRLLPFQFSTSQTFALEVGAGYFRFHTQGATLLAGSPAAYNGATAYAVGDLVSSGGTNYYCIAATTGNVPPNATYWYPMPVSGIYEIPNPYAEADLFDLHFVQSEDVLTIVHPNYPVRELRRYAATKWILATVSFSPSLAAPASVTATPNGTGSETYTYKVTAVDNTGKDESAGSSSASCTNSLPTGNNYNTIAWAAVSGASRYNVYKQSNGIYGYIGQTDATSFKDNNIGADMTKTLPLTSNPFNATGDYPGAVSYYEQRRCFGGPTNKPQNFWMTRSGTESNLNYSIPTRDDDAIAFRIAARERNAIRHIVPMQSLILLTNSTEWVVTSVNSDAITPTSVAVRPQSYVGASNMQPIIANANVLYGSSRGGHFREIAFSYSGSSLGGYVSNDLSLRAPHLFDDYDLTDQAYAKSPYPVAWIVSTSGKLLGLTYIPEQQISAWHQHDTYTGNRTVQSYFESVCVVSEGNEEAVYVIVRRTIGGLTKRYVERFASRSFADHKDAYFVDCGLTYSGAAATTISGLDHLNGEVVNILADGAVHPQRTVSGGSITLDRAATKVQIGLPITADLQTLPAALEMQGFGQGRQKNVNKVFLRVHKSGGIFVGPALDKLTEFKQRTTEMYGTPPDLKSEEIAIPVSSQWQDGGQIYIRQNDPLPLTVVSMSMEVAIGG